MPAAKFLTKAESDQKWLINTVKRFKEATMHPTAMSFERANIVADALRMLAVSDDLAYTETAHKLNQAATLIDGKH